MVMVGQGLFLAPGREPPVPTNAAPSIAPVVLNFDRVSNRPPIGTNQYLTFEVTAFQAPNRGPSGRAQSFEFDVTKPI